MGIVQMALSKLFAPSMSPLTDRVTVLEQAMTDLPVLTDEDRATIAKAAALVAEFEAIAEGTIETPPADPNGGGITVTDVTP